MAGFNKCARFGTELTYNVSTGDSSAKPFSATLQENPSVIVFSNMSNVAVFVSDSQVTSGKGKTFQPNEIFTIDCSTNRTHNSEDLTWRLGTQFYATSTAGTGTFYIDLIYAE